MAKPIVWRNDADERRLATYRANTHLYKGDFTKVWRKLIPPDIEFKPVIMNDAKNITDAIANLLFREAPGFVAATNFDAQPEIDRIIRDTNFNTTLKDQGIWGSVYGDSVFLVRHDEKQVQIDFVHPGFFFAIFEPFNLNNVLTAILKFPLFDNEGQIRFVYQQIHRPGTIFHELWRADSTRLLERLPLVDRPETAHLIDVERTGVDEILVVHAKNINCPGEPYGLSDYTPAIKTKFRARSAILTQFDMVRAKHSNPKLALPQSMLDSLRNEETGEISVKREDLDMIGLEQGEDVKMIVWDGELKVSLEESRVLQEQIFDEAKISPALLGKSGGGIEGGETGRASIMKLLASLGLAHTKQQLLEPAIQKVLRVAQKLENSRREPSQRYDPSEVKIAWRDGLPADSLTDTQRVSIRLADGTMSKIQAIVELDGVTEKEAAVRIALIDADTESIE